ncbi:Uma2 family endonuclease [Kitasatospora sp. NPDC004531]
MNHDFAALRAVLDLLPAVPDLRPPEISGGTIRLPLAPGSHHDRTAELICRQLVAQSPPPARVTPNAVVESPALGVLRRPDLTVCAAPADRPLLVAEVVSPYDPETDYRAKVADYAAMGIPLYLLVDPRLGTGIVHAEPGCTRRTDFAFGDVLTVGPWTLDTGVLRTYAG